MLNFYKRYADNLLKVTKIKGYDMKIKKGYVIQGLIVELICLIIFFAGAFHFHVLDQPIFWVWIGGLFLISCVFGLIFFILSGTSSALYALTAVIWLVSGLVFINAFPQKDVALNAKMLVAFFAASGLAVLTALSAIDYLIIRNYRKSNLPYNE